MSKLREGGLPTYDIPPVSLDVANEPSSYNIPRHWGSIADAFLEDFATAEKKSW